MKPGATTMPSRSITRAAVSVIAGAMRTMVSPCTARSARYHGLPVPSTMRALRRTRSYRESAAFAEFDAVSRHTATRTTKPRANTDSVLVISCLPKKHPLRLPGARSSPSSCDPCFQTANVRVQRSAACGASGATRGWATFYSFLELRPATSGILGLPLLAIELGDHQFLNGPSVEAPSVDTEAVRM